MAYYVHSAFRKTKALIYFSMSTKSAMDENEDHKEVGWSDSLEDWNFVVHSNKSNTGTDETVSDGESVEILSRERLEDSSLETDEIQCGSESHDSEPADSDNESNSADEDNGDAENDTSVDCNCAPADDDTTEDSSQVTHVGVFPEENIIPSYPAETVSETVSDAGSTRPELELPMESRKIIVVAGLVLFIGWFLLIFHVRSEENIDKIKLDNDVKWQTMNEKYSKLMQELAIYKEKSQLMDLSLNDLKALQVDEKAPSCKFYDEKWQQMHEKYLKLEKDLSSFKEESNSLEEIRNNVKNRMKSHEYGSFGGEKIEKPDCGSTKSEKSSYCDKDGQEMPQHSEILRLIQRLDLDADFEKSPYDSSEEEPEFVDIRGKFFNIKRAFETSDVQSFEDDFEKLYEILSKDKDEFIGVNQNLIFKYNSEMYASFLIMMDGSEKFMQYLNETDPRSAEELDNLARISYEYVLSNLQKSNYNVAKLMNDYKDFAKAIKIDIGYSARRYGQKRLNKERGWKSSKSESSKFDNFDNDSKKKSHGHSKEVDESFKVTPSLISKCADEVFEHYYKFAATNEEIRKILEQVPQSIKESDSYIHIVCDRIHTNLHDASIVLSRFMDSFDNLVNKVKSGNVAKKHHKKKYKDKQEFKPSEKEHVKYSHHHEESSKTRQKNYERKFDERKDYQDERKGKPEYSVPDQDEGNVFKLIKSKINNYKKIIVDKANIFNKKIKNHTMRVSEKFQKKIKSVLNFEKAKKLNEKIVTHGTKIKNKLTQKFDSLWDSVSKKLKNATSMAVASSEWLFDFGEEQEKKEDVEENKDDNNNNLNLNNWMFKRAEFRNTKREDTAYWYFRRGNARRRNVEKYKKL